MFLSKYKFILVLFFVSLFQVVSLIAQTIKKSEIDWKDNLFAKNINYENFSCQDSDRKMVSEFFKTHPLIRILNICHNNCAVLKTFSDRKIPPFSDKIKGNGFIAIHILANENGRPIFARAVNGNSLFRKLIEKRACESKFKENQEKRQNVFYYCPTEKCTEPQPVEK